jgi:hypothetical protein
MKIRDISHALAISTLVVAVMAHSEPNGIVDVRRVSTSNVDIGNTQVSGESLETDWQNVFDCFFQRNDISSTDQNTANSPEELMIKLSYRHDTPTGPSFFFQVGDPSNLLNHNLISHFTQGNTAPGLHFIFTSGQWPASGFAIEIVQPLAPIPDHPEVLVAQLLSDHAALRRGICTILPDDVADENFERLVNEQGFRQ